MVSIFLKNGITPIVSIGKKLNPNQHQAMMEIDDDQKEPGTIVQGNSKRIYDERQTFETSASRCIKKN